MADDLKSVLMISEQRKTLKNMVLDKLRDAILNLHFQPGQRLIERELCSLMGVSRTAVREALSYLEAEGLVTLVPNKGPIVAEVSVELARDIYEVRAALEGLACQLFVARATDQQVKLLISATAEIERAFKSADIHRVLESTAAFYDVLFTGCGNQVVRSTIQPLLGQVNYLRATSMFMQERHADSIQEIRNIVEAIKRRDSNSAFCASVAHVHAASEAALAVLKQRELPAAIPMAEPDTGILAPLSMSESYIT